MAQVVQPVEEARVSPGRQGNVSRNQSIGMAAGAILGGVVGGPPGALTGAGLGGQVAGMTSARPTQDSFTPAAQESGVAAPGGATGRRLSELQNTPAKQMLDAQAALSALPRNLQAQYSPILQKALEQSRSGSTGRLA